jgi:type II secretory pathway component GspD/PulD (secretin)
MKINKIILFILLFTIGIIANEQNYELAKVNRTTIDLYDEPKNDSSKIPNKFKYNETIKIYYCNKENWCKTDNGYVKEYLLHFETLKEVIKENRTSSVINPNERITKKWKNKTFYRISVDESVKDILTAIAKQNNSKIIFDKNINEIETISLEDIPLEAAFNLLLQRNNLEYSWEDNTIIVSSIKDTKIKKEFIILKNITIEKLVILLKRYNLYTKIKNKVIFDNEMNAIYIEAQESVITDLQNILMKFETAEKLLRETRIKRTKEDIEYKRLENINRKQIAISNKKKKYGLNAYDDWQMKIEIIPLKYISVTAKEMEFQGEKIKLESLEDTLKGLLGTGYANINKRIDKYDSNSSLDRTSNSSIKMEEAYLKVDARTNSLIVKDYPDRIEEIKKIIIKLDKPVKLIEIEVTIATGSKGFTNRLGMALGMVEVNGARTTGFSTSDGISSNINNIQQSKPVDTLATSGILGLSASYLFSNSKQIINSQLSAMESEGIGKVLSNPKMVTLNNKEATIVSGKSITISVSNSDTSGFKTVNSGISIKSTPHIIEKDNDEERDIKLDISIESSSLGDTTGGLINKDTNKINTNIIMKEGQTLILGGLFQYTENTSDGGVPFLKDIPILGYFFSTKTKVLNKSELVFFITPRIIDSTMVYKKQSKRIMNYNNKLINERENFLKDKIIPKEKKIKKIKTKEDITTEEEHKKIVNELFGI